MAPDISVGWSGMPSTLAETLSLVRSAKDDREGERLLALAIAAIESCMDARTILREVETMPTGHAQIRELAERTLELAEREGEVWGIRDAASALANYLDDHDAARSALVRGERAFAARGVRGYVWELLARGHAALFDDREAIERCLDAGQQVAEREHDVSDRCSVALGWAELIDRARGLAQLEQIERDIEDASGAWSLANAWAQVGDEAAARRVLERALERVALTDDALVIARAWASHRQPADAKRALAKAEALAQQFGDWYQMAEMAASTQLGDEAIRHALAGAERVVPDDEARMLLASAHATWLGDLAAADRLGPRGLRPELLRTARATLEGWSGSASRLFDLLRARVDDATLRSIAEADYGSDAALHHAALRDICTSGLVPRQLRWHPGEVLSLTRWVEGEGTNHLARALACTLLCLIPGDDDDLVTNGPILLDSCLILGEPLISACIELFVWRIETSEDPSEVDARLLVLFGQATIAPKDPRLGTLVSTVAEAAFEGLAGTMRERLWHELIDRVLAQLPELRRAFARG